MDVIPAGAWLSRISQYTCGMSFLSCVVDDLSVNVLVRRVSLILAVVNRVPVVLTCIISGLRAAPSKS